MWNKIVNPKTGRKVNLNSKMGKSILKNYIKQLGGAAGAAVPVPSKLNLVNKCTKFHGKPLKCHSSRQHDGLCYYNNNRMCVKGIGNVENGKDKRRKYSDENNRWGKTDFTKASNDLNEAAGKKFLRAYRKRKNVGLVPGPAPPAPAPAAAAAAPAAAAPPAPLLEDCPICLERMNPQEILIKCHNDEIMARSHLYHLVCITRVQNQQECSVCRQHCDVIPNTIQGYAIFTDALVPLMRGIINRFYNGVLPQNNTIVELPLRNRRIYIRLSSDDIGQDESNGTMESPYTLPLNPNDWDVSNVTNMEEMFEQAPRFNHPIGGWNVSRVENMSGMFSKSTSFNQPIGGWDVSNVKNMSGMFSEATDFNQPLGGWVVSDVENMSAMFMEAISFNQPIGGWVVSDVENMSFMFSGARSFNQPIGDWDVSNVKNMSFMFSGARSFNQPLGDWVVHNVEDMNNFNLGAGLLVDLPPFDYHHELVQPRVDA